MDSRAGFSQPWGWPDTVLALAVAIATYVYVGYIWPALLNGPDEGAFIYTAKRILDGDVMYRDFFDLTGPVAHYLLALWYWLFGTTMQTSRLHTALQHAIIAGFMYGICRTVGVRRSVAAVCALMDLALFYPQLAMAMPHWVATMFSVILFWWVIRAPLHTPRAAALAGIFTALVGLTRQPAGGAIAVAAALVLLHDACRTRTGASWIQALLRQTGYYAAGLLVVLAPVLGAFVAMAGLAPVVDSLIVVPLGSYRSQPFINEGGYMLFKINAALMWKLIVTASPMLILNVMPWIIPISAVRLGLYWRTAVDPSSTRPFFVAVVFSALAIISMLYQPNFFHFAIVGPIWGVLYAEMIERIIARLSLRLQTAIIEPIAVAAVALLLALRVGHDLPETLHRVVATDVSSYGRIELRSTDEANDIAAIRSVLREAGATQIFIYPGAAALYLMTETRNPTRFQLLVGEYTDDHIDEVRQTLDRERVPFVVRSFYWWGPKGVGDRLRPYLNEHYEPVPIPRQKGGFPHLHLLRRRPEAAVAERTMG